MAQRAPAMRSLSAAVRSIASARRSAPLDHWTPTEPQRDWLADTSPIKLLRGPNQGGKTQAGAAELLYRLRGRHPYQQLRHPAPIRAWVVCASWKQSLVIQAKVRELIGDDELGEDTHYTPKNGFSGQYLSLTNGSTCRFVTAEQDTVHLASETLHFVWIDEPPPEGIWSELLARVRNLRGVIALTMTPIGRPVEWLRKLVEEGAVSDHVYSLTVANCTPIGCVVPFITQAVVDNFRASCLPIERAQRCDGAWEGVSDDRMFAAFGDHLITDELPASQVLIAVGVDHGAKAGRQRAVLVYATQIAGHARAWIVDESASTERSGVEQDARGILDMLARNGVALHEVDYWIGDRRHGGDWRGNQKSNRDLKRAIALLTRKSLDELPAPLRFMSVPRKWSGSVAYGVRLMNKMMADDLLTVSPRAKEVIEGMRYWMGSPDDPKKDAVDAARYAIEKLVDARAVYASDRLSASVATPGRRAG